VPGYIAFSAPARFGIIHEFRAILRGPTGAGKLDLGDDSPPDRAKGRQRRGIYPVDFASRTGGLSERQMPAPAVTGPARWL